MVGAETVRQDDPRLTDRVTRRGHQPRAVVVSRHPGDLPGDARLFTERASSVVLVLPEGRRDHLPSWIEERGVNTCFVPTRRDRIHWPRALEALVEHHLGRLLVEGGGFLAGTLLEAGVVNELHLFSSGRIFGEGVRSVRRELPGDTVEQRPRARLLETRRFGEDVYVRRLLYDALVERGVPDGFVSGTDSAWIPGDGMDLRRARGD